MPMPLHRFGREEGELPGFGDGGVDAADGLHVTGGGGLGRVLPQVGRVAVIPAQVALVDGLDVVADRPVVAVRVPGRLQRRRDLDHLGDLAADVSLVQQPQRLVVQERVQVPLLAAASETGEELA
jgi:hypothetical protein